MPEPRADGSRTAIDRLRGGWSRAQPRLKGELWIELGALGYLLTLPFGPTLPSLARDLPLVVLFIGLVLGAFSPSADRVSYRLLLPFALFAGSTLLAIVVSEQPDTSADRSRYAPVAFLFFFAAQHLAASPDALRRFGATLSAVFLLIGIDALWQLGFGASLLSGHEPSDSRISGSLPHPNDLAIFPILLPLLALSPPRSSPARWFTAASVGLGLTAVVLSGSRTAWLGVATVAVLSLWVSGNRRRFAQIAAAGAAVLLLAFALDVASLRERVTTVGVWQSQGRFAIWSVAWRMFLEAPLLGKGAHLFGEYYALYLADVSLSLDFVREARPIPWAHNIYLEFLAERGLVGFAAWGVFVVAIARAALRTPAAIACALSLTAFVVMGLLDLTFYKDWVALVFCLIAGLSAQLSPRASDASGAPPAAP